MGTWFVPCMLIREESRILDSCLGTELTQVLESSNSPLGPATAESLDLARGHSRILPGLERISRGMMCTELSAFVVAVRV